MSECGRVLVAEIREALRVAGAFYSAHPEMLLAAVLPGGRQHIREAIAQDLANRVDWERLHDVTPPSTHQAIDLEVNRLMALPPGMSQADGDDPESWTNVAGNYGPVTVESRRVDPSTDSGA